MTNLTKRQKETILVVLSVLFLILLVAYSYFTLYAPAKEANTQVKQSVANERDVLFALRKQDAQNNNHENTGSQPMQRKVPVKPIQDIVMLQIEKAEIKSNTLIQDVNFSLGDFVIENPPENVSDVHQLLTEVELETYSYKGVEKFIDEIENMDRIFIVDAIKIEVPKETQELNDERESIKVNVSFTAFYRPDLTNLYDEVPKNNAPIPANKLDPTPYMQLTGDEGAE